MNNTTTLTKFLNGINSTLNIMNKAVPLYKEVSPMIKNFNKTYKNIKNGKNELSNTIKLLKLKNKIKKDFNNEYEPKTISKKNTNINSPQFFI